MLSAGATFWLFVCISVILFWLLAWIWLDRNDF